MDNIYMNMVQNYANNGSCAAKNDGDFFGDDGLLYCGKCREAKQARIETIDAPVPVMCRCERDKIEKEAQRERQEQIQRNRRECFAGCTEQYRLTFERDRCYSPRVSEISRAYVDKFERFRQDGAGVLFYGAVGTGKSFYSAAIANALIDRGYRVRCATLDEFYRETRAANIRESADFFPALAAHDLVVVDDLGAEVQTATMRAFAYSVVDTLYKHRTLFVVTTNFSAEEIKASSIEDFRRIFDRILERCVHPVKVEYSGGSVRRQIVREKIAEYDALLGI